MAGQWALWEKGIEHGDISTGNLMCDPVTKRGVLNDLDLAREGGLNRKPSARDNTGTIPFLALDLLNKAGFNGKVQRRYRHDAESFAWCLINICVCMGKDPKRGICTVNPHPLSSWFGNVATSYRAKYNSEELNGRLPLHERTKPLAKALHTYWMKRYHFQVIASRVGCEPRALADAPSNWNVPVKAHLQTQGPYEEPPDDKSITVVLQIITQASGVIPQSLANIFLRKLDVIDELYPSLSPEPLMDVFR